MLSMPRVELVGGVVYELNAITMLVHLYATKCSQLYKLRSLEASILFLAPDFILDYNCLVKEE